MLLEFICIHNSAIQFLVLIFVYRVELSIMLREHIFVFQNMKYEHQNMKAHTTTEYSR